MGKWDTKSIIWQLWHYRTNILIFNVSVYNYFVFHQVWPRQQCGGLVGNRLGRNGPQNGTHQSQKKPRRRVATMAQRRAANIRERRRMFNLNEAFDKLRRKVKFKFSYSLHVFLLHLGFSFIKYLGVLFCRYPHLRMKNDYLESKPCVWL